MQVVLLSFAQLHFRLFIRLSPFLCSHPARDRPPIIHRTTIQSITITSKKENIKESEQRNRTEPSPSIPTSSPPVSSPLSPPAQPSVLASLLARKRSIVTVPATKEVSPPLRGSSRPSSEKLPYLPHSPFHLFSYDLNEEPSPPEPAKPSEESPKPTSPRSEGQQNSISHEFKKHRQLFLFPLKFHFSFFKFPHLFLPFIPAYIPSLTSPDLLELLTSSLSILLLSPIVPSHLFF